MFSAALLGITAHQTVAQDYPTRGIRFVVPFPVGAGTDILARGVAQKLNEAWSVPVVVDNRAGAGGTIGSDLVAKAPKDGYTMLMGNASSLAIARSLYKNLSYDPLKDFANVILVANSENIVVVHPSLPVRTIKDLVAMAKARPGQIFFSSAGSGTTGHLGGELLRATAAVEIVHVPYKGSPPSMNDLVAGQVQMSVTSIAGAIPFVRSNRLRPVATTGLIRNPVLPGVPTVAETYPGFEVNAWQGIVVPAGTPANVIARMNGQIGKILQGQDIRDQFAAQGLLAAGGTPEQFTAYHRKETEKWAEVVRRSGARPD
jgi:tripartite-type tricarboxylate transporter receptor subunit TctC